MLIKNQITTYNLNNTSGSTALLGAQTGRDSSLVTRLRNAGVVILGTANLTQWGNSRDPKQGNGWSADVGQTLGVYFPNQDPWGSSSGSATGTAIGLSFAALGTEVRPWFSLPFPIPGFPNKSSSPSLCITCLDFSRHASRSTDHDTEQATCAG